MKVGSSLIISLTLCTALTNVAFAQTTGGIPSRSAIGSLTPKSFEGVAATKSGPNVNGTGMIRPTARTGVVGGSTKGASATLSGTSFALKHP